MKGYFVPQLSLEEEAREIYGLQVSLPRLTPQTLLEISDELIAAQRQFAERPLSEIIDWIDGAARRWLDPRDSIRQEAASLLPLSGLSPEMTNHLLEELFSKLTRPRLLQLIEEELGDLLLLDQFRPKSKQSGLTRAFGPRLIAQILPGNLPGISIIGIVLGLLAKSASLVKVSSDDWILPLLFARSLEKSAPAMARNVAILTWENDSPELTRAAFQKAELAIVYGGDETIANVREMIPPYTRAIFHGHKVSLGVIARESILPSLAEAAATDIALYDQRGCLSPHLYYLEEGGKASPLAFAESLAQALDLASKRLPKAVTTEREAAQIHQLRGAVPAKGGTVFSSPNGVDWTVLYDPDPAFSLSPLARTIWIKPVARLLDIPERLEAVRPYLQSVGIAIPARRQPELLLALARMGVSRICPIGKMQTPPLTWRQDGRFPFLDLLRFVDLEKI